jgi:uncharacterized protein (DUF1697 family)
MASVIFFRATNVGGHQVFRPSALAKQLADFGVVNVGAAGTFVVRETVSAARLRNAIFNRLPFKPELIICPAGEVCHPTARNMLALVNAESFLDEPVPKGITRYVTILQKAPAKPPRLPLEFPAVGKWEVKLVAIIGRFALSLHRPGSKKIYPNAVLEKSLGVPATTRNWNTILAIHKILEK